MNLRSGLRSLVLLLVWLLITAGYILLFAYLGSLAQVYSESGENWYGGGRGVSCGISSGISSGISGSKHSSLGISGSKHSSLGISSSKHSSLGISSSEHSGISSGISSGMSSGKHSDISNDASSGVSDGERVSESETAERLTILSIPGLSFLELTEPWLTQMPELQRLLREGALGAVNTRLAGQGGKDSYVSIGSGRRSVSGPAQAYTQREKVEGYSANLIYRRYTGTDSGQEAIVIPSIDRMRRANQSSSYRGRPGSLGDLLRRNYIQTNVWGNADVEGEAESEGTGSGKGLRRYAAFALMTRQGTVEQGDVSQATLMPSPYHAGGVTTDYSFLTNKWRQRADRSISLLELGDLQRLYTFKSRYSENSFLAHQQVVLKEIDHFIGTVRNQIGDNEELWILSPGVHSEANRRKLTMSPLLLYRKDGQRGLVRTESTRRDGIVTLLDLTPTITDRLGLGNEKDWTGKAVSIKPYEQPLSFLQRELGRMEAVYRLRPPLLTAFTVYEMIVLFFGLYFVWFQKNRDSPIMRALLWSILVAPVLLFALGWGVGGSGLVISQGGSGVHAAASHGSYGTWIDISQVVLLVVMLAAISAGLARMNLLAAFSLIGVVTASVLLLDGWTGAEVMKRSVLGYDPIIGARFYGMGNELMGVLVGSAALGTMAWAQNGRRASRISWRQGSLAAKPLLVWGLAGGYAALLLYLAMPSGGANAGGAITASVALGMSWLGLGTADRPPRPRIRTIWLILVLLITALIVLWVANAVLKGASSSHIGDSFRYLLAGNGGEIRSIIARKLKMNLHLIRVSIWSKVVLTCVLVIAALLLKPPRRMLCWKKAYPLLVNGWIAITMGAVVALVFNDSGIVAAGTMITYATVPMLLVAVEENAHSISSSH